MRKLLTLGLNLILTATVFGQLEENITLSEPITGNTTVVAKRKITLSPGFHAPAGTKFTAQIDYFAASDNHFDHNFVKTETALISGSTENSIDYLAVEQKSTVFNYFDGLGRQVQTVIKQGSPTKKDIVLHIEYDHLGRQVREYLPYSVKSQNGAFRGEASGEQGYYYNNQTGIANSAYPFAEKVFDNSPLNRVLEQGAPGADWQPHNGSIPNSGHTVGMNYLANTVSDGVIIWTVDNSGNCTNTGTYSVGNLFKNETIDENDHSVIEFVDITGKTILKKTNDGNNNLLTYYVYDDFDRLRYVLPPKATNQTGTSLTPASLSELIYYYEYDEKGRMIKKKIPGADEVLMIYDNRDRLILTQDGNLRSQGKWSFTKYDVLNRPIITGIVQITGSNYDQLVTAFKNHSTHYESINTSETYKYTLNNSYPSEAAITESDLLTVIYYDNYNSLSSYGYNYSLPSGFDAVTRETKPINQVTGTLVWNLDKSEYYVTVNYYDEYRRIIQTIAENHLSGIDILTTQYDFVGKVTQTKLTHTIDASLDPVEKNIWEFYDYDHAGRLTDHYHQYGNSSADKVLMAAYKYNENGEQIAKKMHSEDGGSNYLQEVDYKYNIRGWLTKINDADLSNNKDLFGMELVYNNPVTNIDPTIEENHNGNITGMYWNTNGTFKKKRGYGFKYDDINRLTNAYYGDNSGWTNGLYDVQGITYDLNGNIESISRNAGAENGEIDNLDYVYNGNKLVAVGDNAVGNDYLGFDDRNPGATGTEYMYDANGNMKTNLNKSIDISYNVLNLPSRVTPALIANRFYLYYDALGNKLGTKTTSGQPDFYTKKEYIGNFIYLALYEMGTLSYHVDYILTPEGRITFGDAGEVNYEYFLKDHLGNNRVVFADYDNNGTAEIVQEDSYYPFGMQMAGLSERASGIKPNQYLYNGKELHQEMGLGWYDYGARFYDPALARFHTIDPLAEKFPFQSQYLYAASNPIRYIDVDGMWAGEPPGAWSNSLRAGMEHAGASEQEISEYLQEFGRRGLIANGIGMILGVGVAAVPYMIQVYSWAAANPVTTTYIAGTLANAADPNPGADWTPGLPGDEVLGNLIGQGVRSLSKTPIGKWVTESTKGWSAAAKSYQEFVTGVKAGNAFEVNGIKFDGVIDDILVDAKSSYNSLIDKSTGQFRQFFKVNEDLVDQARRQLKAADGVPVRWYFETTETLNATQKLFELNGIEGIELIFHPRNNSQLWQNNLITPRN